VQQDARFAKLYEAATGALAALVDESLSVLNRGLGGRDWLVGSHFTVADLNVAGVLSPSRSAHLDLAGFPRVVAWLARSYARPAARETRKRFI
jgi:glutathione S-transferase